MEFKVLILLLIPLLSQAVDLEFPECSPHLTVVPIDHPTYGYYPFFVKLHRCGGSCGMTQPSVRECVTVDSKSVTVDVIPFAEGANKFTIDVLNHTKCGCQCVTKASDCNTEVQVYDEANCQCTCRYKDTAPKACPEGHEWNAHQCACVCNRAPEICPRGKYWSQRSCGCVCNAETIAMCNKIGKVTNDDCECVNSDYNLGATGKDKPNDNKSSKLMLILMIAEFGVLFLVFDAIMYRKKAGLTYHIVRKCACKGKSSKDIKSIATSVTSVSTQDAGYTNEARKESVVVQAV